MAKQHHMYKECDYSYKPEKFLSHDIQVQKSKEEKNGDKSNSD